MASSSSFNGSPQILVPPSPTRDCSQGFCTAYCPQWCYVFPPPPYDFSDGGGSSTTLSPLVIAIIGILAGALLLVTYYTIISKYCGTFESLWGFLLGPGGGSREAGTDQSIPAEELHGSSPSSGISKSLIDKMVICKYKRGDGLVNCTDCAVCLSEFREEENFRLLPECSHAFHVQCIDTWLKSHTNCPICRAGIVAELPPPPPPPPLPPLPSSSSSSSRGQRNRQEVVVDVDEPVLAADEEAQVRNNGGRAKRRSGETANGRIEIRDEGVRRNNPEDSSRRGNSIATVLQTSMEVEMSAAKEQSRRRG